ncbi:MAG: hypothetical protein HQM00_01155 [Magnetococcales bacterium]|nr:hypothetical protein [Magnetococcales bacterium]
MMSREARKIRFGWIVILAMWIWGGGVATPIAFQGVGGGAGVVWADATLPAGAVPLGTLNAEMGEQGKLAVEQQAADLAYQHIKDFRNFFILWILMMLIGFLIWRFRPRKPWVAPSAPAKPEVEVEVEEDEEAAVIRPVLADTHSRRTRDALATIALGWEERYGLSPLDLSVIAARDAALLVGMSDERYSLHMQDRVFPAPSDVDFIYNKKKYVVRSVRQSPTSDAHQVAKVPAQGWDFLVFVMYDAKYVITGAWQMPNDTYLAQCARKERLTPEDCQLGKSLLAPSSRSS